MIDLLRRSYYVLKNEGFKSFIYKVLRFFLATSILLISKIFPTKQNLIILGSRHGVEYKDSPRYVFEYIVEHRTNICPIWMTNNSEVHDRLISEGLPTEKIDSLRGYYLLLRANIAVYTHGPGDVSAIGKIPANTKVLHLGHGRPVKYDEEFKRQNDLVEREKIKTERIDYVIQTSDFMVNSLPLIFDWPPFKITGRPRNDILIHTPERLERKWREYCEQFDFHIDNTILYAPTVRKPKYTKESSTTDFFPFEDFDKYKLFEYLEECEGLLLIRPHPWDMEQIENSEQQYGTTHKHQTVSEFLSDLTEHRRVRIAGEQIFPDTNRLLPFIDILITDYSSIYHDFLLLDRPIIFIAYDYESFKSDFGFIYNYLGNLPGVKADTFQEFLNSLDNSLESQEYYGRERHELRDKIHKYQDGESTKRVVQVIDDIINC